MNTRRLISNDKRHTYIIYRSSSPCGDRLDNPEKKMKTYEDFKTDEAWQKYLRRYYAGLAMAELLKVSTYSLAEINQGACCDISEVAIVMADQLIRDLNKPQS